MKTMTTARIEAPEFDMEPLFIPATKIPDAVTQAKGRTKFTGCYICSPLRVERVMPGTWAFWCAAMHDPKVGPRPLLPGFHYAMTAPSYEIAKAAFWGALHKDYPGIYFKFRLSR